MWYEILAVFAGFLGACLYVGIGIGTFLLLGDVWDGKDVLRWSTVILTIFSLPVPLAIALVCLVSRLGLFIIDLFFFGPLSRPVFKK